MEAIIKFLREEWGELIKAPTSFATLTVLCLVLGFSAGMLYYNSQIGALREQINVKDGQLNAKDGQLSRYRVALGIDPPAREHLLS